MSETPERDVKRELELMNSIYGDLKDLPAEARKSVLSWVADALGITGASNKASPAGTRTRQQDHVISDQVDNTASNSRYKTFAELYDAAHPGTNRACALVGGYWLQVCQGAEDFVSMDANKLLKDVGANISNITVAFDGLINSNPRLVLQVRKSGKAQQGRKQYKLTVVGIRSVEGMIRGDAALDE